MLRISNNWQCGRYKWKNIKPCRVNVMPWLQMTSNSLWWSGGYQLCGFKRSSNYFRKKHNDYDNCFYQNMCDTDICKFVLYKNSLISGHRCVYSVTNIVQTLSFPTINFFAKTLHSNGDIQYWRDISHGYPSSVKKLKCAHACDINGIDATSQNIISGSNDGMIKVRDMLCL